MFRMTSSVKVDSFKPFKPTNLKWKRSIENYSDYAMIKIPAKGSLVINGKVETMQTASQFKEGMKVELFVGYNDNNMLRFKGFVRRVNYTVPCEIECEGYSYQLRKKLNFTKNYSNSTVKKILEDLVEGTDIKLSKSIPNVPIKRAEFRNCTGTQVIDWLKDKCLLTVYFNFDELYCGLAYVEPKSKIKLRLGWNVIKDNSLKFNDKKEFANVRIKLVQRGKTGVKKVSFYGPKDGQVVEKKISLIDDPKVLEDIAKREKERLTNRGYEGSLTTFLEPCFNVGDSIMIEDLKYQERKGTYLGTGVEGEFSSSGGRQKITIGMSLGV